MKRVICWLLGHNDTSDIMKFGIVYGWRCKRCGRKREYVR